MYCRYFTVAFASVIAVEFCEIELCLLGAVRWDTPPLETRSRSDLRDGAPDRL
jgi:hypothetical protein